MPKLLLQLPAAIEADDYHEFANILHTLEKFGVSGVKMKEVPNSSYCAMFYVGALTDIDNAQMFAQLKADWPE